MVTSSESLGVAFEYVEDLPFSGTYLKVSKFPNQAQFNPARYINGLAKEFEAIGGVILEEHMVTDTCSEKTGVVVGCANKSFKA